MFQALPESPRHDPISALQNSSSQDKGTTSAVPLICRAAAADTLELWGGVECSIVRIGNEFRNQLSETRHLTRDDDLALIAKLGIRTLRYPVLWEMVSPNDPNVSEWRWADSRLDTLRKLSITPVAGLLHHGSGPQYTNLLDNAFPALLARYAAQVAERYPWIDYFTPVNEPLTTARFSALYGHWYPHARDTRLFLRALVNQCLGILLSMRAIREINRRAKLVQTEDLGRTFSTPRLSYQAEFENERRWLALDLLCGLVDRTHPLYEFMVQHGVAEDELEFCREHACPPDIVGINHYLTSERFLDERLGIYPAEFHGGNGRETYSDVEAVRIELPRGTTGPQARLLEAWLRYRRPIAVTETHHGCSRDEQIRWLAHVWNAAVEVKQKGVDIRAVTVWSLFGARDWNSLLTRRDGFYEPGAFDTRSSRPRKTAIARMAALLAGGGRIEHPVLDSPGWWERHGRFYIPQRAPVPGYPRARKLLITGARGTLARAIAKVCEHRALEHVLLSRQELDITDPAQLELVIEREKPWAIVNAAGFVRVAEASREKDRCFRENTRGPECLAGACARRGIPLVIFSSDLVFNGRLGRPYEEPDTPCPICVYGSSKAQAEALVQRLYPEALIIRTSAFFGPSDPHNFAYRTLAAISAGKSVRLAAGEAVSPTYVPDLAHAVLDLLVDGEAGIWHLVNAGASSWLDLGREIADRAGLSQSLILPDGTRSRNTSLATRRGQLLPRLDDALHRFFKELDPLIISPASAVFAVNPQETDSS